MATSPPDDFWIPGLADRMVQLTGVVDERTMRAQYLGPFASLVEEANHSVDPRVNAASAVGRRSPLGASPAVGRAAAASG